MFDNPRNLEYHLARIRTLAFAIEGIATSPASLDGEAPRDHLNYIAGQIGDIAGEALAREGAA